MFSWSWIMVVTILCLLFRSGPPAIVRLIVAVIVDSVESHSVRSFSHVSKKILKLEPSFANRYSFFNIMTAFDSVLHRIPRNICWTSISISGCVSMRSIDLMTSLKLSFVRKMRARLNLTFFVSHGVKLKHSLGYVNMVVS